MFANSDSSWNYDFLSSLWQNNTWLDQAAANDVKTHFGAYAISNPSGLQGLKVISINTDFWYGHNIFNYVNYSNPDPNGILKFLISELEESEAAHQRVWIIGHVPTGTDALPNPSALFQSIVVRFSPTTIAAIFWGHTHWEQVGSATTDVLEPVTDVDTQKMIYYDFAPDSLTNGQRNTAKVDSKSPLTVGWIGASVTSSGGPQPVNPAWSYYEVDNTYSILNAETYYADLSRVSKDWTVTPFNQLYDARKAYDPTGKSPKDKPLDASFWDDFLAQNIDTDVKLSAMYNKYEVRNAQTLVNCTSETCMQYKKCNIQAGTSERAYLCLWLNEEDSNMPD